MCTPRWRTVFSLILPVAFVVVCRAHAQTTTAWSQPVRGSWVQGGPASAGDIVVGGAGSTSEIVVSVRETPAVHKAADFLARDIERISGYRPPVVLTPTSGDKVRIHFVTLGGGDIPRGLDAGALRGTWEAYQVLTEGKNVWLVGSDAHGTAFAGYTLSERIGVDPLYLWTGSRPDHHDPLVLKATRFTQGPPTFKYRGFFHDDEDVLPRPFDARGYPLQTGDIPLAWYMRYFETALRLRMNMVAPYVRVHRRYEVQHLASEWGLAFTSHHYDILVSNPYGLDHFNLAQERGVRPEWNWFTNKEGVLRYWRAGLLENRDLDVIWPVGMRGTADRPYTFPEGTTDAQKAQVFRDAIHEQVRMVRDELAPRGRKPVFHFTMYTEMLDQYRRNPGAFDLPEDVIIVWPDDNNGHMRGLPDALGTWKHGVYYHLAYLGSNLSKQTTHIVAPQTIAEQFKSIVDAGATEFMLVNVSELRDYVMGARMIADITWNAPAVYAGDDPAARYVDWWTREYFGSGDHQAAVDAYRQYFELLDQPYRLWYASVAIGSLLDRLALRVEGEAYPPAPADTLGELRARRPRLERALAAEARAEAGMTLAQRREFHELVALGLEIDATQTDAALTLADALQAPDSAGMWTKVLEAREPLERLEVEFMRLEYPPFDRWYGETWIRSAESDNNPHRPYRQLQAFIGADGHVRSAREGAVPPAR